MIMSREQYLGALPGTDRSTAVTMHRQYYAQLVNESTIAHVVRAIGAVALRASTDLHFNDIPLQRWYMASRIMHIARRFEELGDYATEAGLVCVAKEAARQWVNEQTDKNKGTKE